MIGASLIVEDGNVRQNVDFVAPNGKYFANYQNDGNFVVYMGSGSGDNKGALWSSGTMYNKAGQIVMRSQYNSNGKRAALSFSSTKDLAGGNIKKEMISINEGTAPYKLLISDVGRLVVLDQNGHEMIMKNGGNMYSSFYKPAFGSLCGNDLEAYKHGGGSMEIKHQTCANKCAADTNCAGFTLNDVYCFPKKADFLTTGVHESQACINAHGKVRFGDQNRHDGKLFFYKRGECKGNNSNDPEASARCPGKLSAEACAYDSNCKWEGKSNECNLSAARVCGDAVGKETADAVECCRNNNCDDDCQW